MHPKVVYDMHTSVRYDKHTIVRYDMHTSIRYDMHTIVSLYDAHYFTLWYAQYLRYDIYFSVYLAKRVSIIMFIYYYVYFRKAF